MSLSGPTKVIRASDVTCTPSGSTVTVTGDLIGVATIPYNTQPGATIKNSSGTSIGSGQGPILAVNHARATSFSLTIAVRGDPASCAVGWGAAVTAPP